VQSGAVDRDISGTGIDDVGGRDLRTRCLRTFDVGIDRNARVYGQWRRHGHAGAMSPTGGRDRSSIPTT
jgi:hypothetical protein